jgi:hypothetical protein
MKLILRKEASRRTVDACFVYDKISIEEETGYAGSQAAG